jgi:SAM-dependent methyltransferase
VTVDTCPLCDGRDVRPFNAYGPRCLVGDYHITTGHVENVWCARCGLGWNRLMMSDEELARFYAGYTKKVGSEEEDDLLFGTSEADVETLTASQARFVAEHVTAPSGRVLDIGCGKGSFLKSFKAARGGWQYVGVEPSREEAVLARREASFEIHEGMFGSVPLEKNSFDLVAIMHVLEHVSRPADVVRQMADIIKPGGLLFVEVPNTLDLNMFYDVLLFEHLYHFQPATLAWLLRRSGFDIVVHEASTSYGAQRVIARKRSVAAATPEYPAVDMADGVRRWTALWTSMNALAARGAERAAAGQRVAVFGAGMTAATWLVHSALYDAPLVGLFDESPWKIGRTLFDRPIYPLKDIGGMAVDFVMLATMPNSQAIVSKKVAAATGGRTEISGFEMEQRS